MLDFKTDKHKSFYAGKTPYFCGALKRNKRLGEKVLKEFKDEFGYMESSAMILARIQDIDMFYPKGYKIMKALENKAKALYCKIYDAGYRDVVEKVYPNFEAFCSNIEALMKSKKKANCWESSIAMYNRLLKQGATPFIIEIKRSDNKNHYFTLFGLRKGADLTKPGTWGSEAVIVDAWKGIVMQAHDALTYFKNVISLPKIEALKITDANPRKDIKIGET